MKRLIALLGLILVAGCGSFGPQAHTLSLAYKTGDTYKYKFHSTIKQTVGAHDMTLPIQIDMTATESVYVDAVDKNGTADLTITFSDFSMKSTLGGVTNTTTGTPMSPIDVKIAADGTIASVGGNEVSSNNPFGALAGMGGGFFITALLPNHAVKPGDKWSKTFDQSNPNGSGASHVTSNSTYLRDESFKGVSAAVVETRSTATIDVTGPAATTKDAMSGISIKGTLTTDVTTWIDPNGHRIMKSHTAARDDATIDIPNTSPDKNSPAIQGPLTAKGDGTTDLTPA